MIGLYTFDVGKLLHHSTLGLVGTSKTLNMLYRQFHHQPQEPRSDDMDQLTTKMP
jgi:hypothetical protein